MDWAPVALFAYSRVNHLRQTVEALRANEGARETDVTAYCDGAASDAVAPMVNEVRDYLRSVQGFRSFRMVERSHNWGGSNSVIDGITEISREHGRVIVLEDDLVTSPYFLRFVNQGLNLYADDERVASVHGYAPRVHRPLPETYFLRNIGSWGWATWWRSWQHFEPQGEKLLAAMKEQGSLHDFNLGGAYPYTQLLRDHIAGVVDAWDIRWYGTVFSKGKLALHPRQSLVHNIGFDGSGTHCGAHHRWDVSLSERPIHQERVALEEHEEARRIITESLWRARYPQPLKRLAARTLAQIKSWRE